MDPILFVRTCFLAGIGVGILFDAIPYLRTRFLAYGPRASAAATATATKSPQTTPTKPSQTTTPLSLLDALFAYPVPHHWFTHYYILSVSLSLFWGYQLLTRGPALIYLASHTTQDPAASMPLQRVYLAWFLLLVQGSRRLYESLAFLKRSDSTMSLSIYLIGIVYYLLDSVAVWIEGSATLLQLLQQQQQQQKESGWMGWMGWGEFAQRVRAGAMIPAPSLRVVLCLPLFILASGFQHDAHRYLAGLRRYTLPAHPLFGMLICPHYLMECLIYLALALLAAPDGQLVNKTVFATFLFTTVNLGIVAKGAKAWSVERFGAEAQERWMMVPYVW